MIRRFHTHAEQFPKNTFLDSGDFRINLNFRMNFLIKYNTSITYNIRVIWKQKKPTRICHTYRAPRKQPFYNHGKTDLRLLTANYFEMKHNTGTIKSCQKRFVCQYLHTNCFTTVWDVVS